jgi:MFS family permease
LSATFGFSQAFIWPVMLAISIQTNPHISDRLSSAMLALAFISAMIFQPIAGAISDEWGASSCIYLPIASALVLLISVPILCALIRKTELSSGPFQISKNSASS